MVFIELDGVSTEWGGLLVSTWCACMTLAHWSGNEYARLVALAMEGFTGGIVIGIAVCALTGGITYTYTPGRSASTSF